MGARKISLNVLSGPKYSLLSGVWVHILLLFSDEPFQKLCDGLFEKFKDSPPHGDQQEWVQGQGVVAYYVKDEAWCRANIVTVEPARVYVCCLEFVGEKNEL